MAPARGCSPTLQRDVDGEEGVLCAVLVGVGQPQEVEHPGHVPVEVRDVDVTGLLHPHLPGSFHKPLPAHLQPRLGVLDLEQQVRLVHLSQSDRHPVSQSVRQALRQAVRQSVQDAWYTCSK
jgi:hypothetical protein